MSKLSQDTISTFKSKNLRKYFVSAFQVQEWNPKWKKPQMNLNTIK